jgi:crotonobetainyl-CoA:carnitine CoA-transferase CaiB-like acyl-CoA transferase
MESSVSGRVLAGLRVIDAATLAAGPLIATWLGEYGAEVIKAEQPDGGDPLRQWGAQREGVGLMWKSVARNKKCVTSTCGSRRGVTCCGRSPGRRTW